MSEAELKLAKCRHAESWPTFLCHMYCVVPSFYVSGRCPPRAGEKVYLLSTYLGRCVGGRDNCSGYVMRAISVAFDF